MKLERTSIFAIGLSSMEASTLTCCLLKVLLHIPASGGFYLELRFRRGTSRRKLVLPVEARIHFLASRVYSAFCSVDAH